MHFGNHFFRIANTSNMHNTHRPLVAKPTPADAYDIELLYVECQSCGKPVLWEAGRTTELLSSANVDISMLDSTCMLISDGCPQCRPEEWGGFSLSIVRLAGISAEDALILLKPGGTA